MPQLRSASKRALAEINNNQPQQIGINLVLNYPANVYINYRKIDGENVNAENVNPKMKIENIKKEILEKQIDDEGNEFIDIGRDRRVVMSKYKGVNMINIREYYKDADGKMKPGRKGIALNQSEWENLVAIGDKFKF